MPLIDKTVGPPLIGSGNALRLDAQLRLLLHRLDRSIGLALHCFRNETQIPVYRLAQIAKAVRPQRIELGPGFVQRSSLRGERLKALVAHRDNVLRDTREPLHCLVEHLLVARLFRQGNFRSGLRDWLALRRGGCSLEQIGQVSAAADLQPSAGLMLRLLLLRCLLRLPGVIAGHILAPLAAEHADERPAIGKVVLAVVQIDLGAVPRQPDIGPVAVHARRCQQLDLVHRHALCLVDRGGIAMIDMGVVLEVKRHRLAIIELHRHAQSADALDGTQRSVLHAERSFVLQEHDPVAIGKLPRAALDLERDVLTQIAACAHLLAHCLVERADLVIGMRKDDPAGIGLCLPIAIPCFDELGARGFPSFRDMDVARLIIAPKCLARPARSQLTRCLALPVDLLPPDRCDLHRAMTLSGGAERGPRLDRLQLLRIAHHYDLRTSALGFGYHALHLTRAEHASFVNDEHMHAGELFPPLRPLVLQAGKCARGNARAMLQPFGRNAGQGCPLHRIASAHPCLARNPQHRAFPRSGISDDIADALGRCDMLQRPALLRRQVHAACFCILQSKLTIAIGHMMAAPCFQPDRCALQALLGLDHLARSEPVIALAVLAKGNELGRVLHRRHHGIELLFVGAVPVREHRKVTRGERRLLMRNGAERDVWIGDDLLAVRSRDIDMLGQPLGRQPFARHARGRSADLRLRFQVDALSCQRAVIDAGIDIELGHALVGMAGPCLAPVGEQFGPVPVAHLGAERSIAVFAYDDLAHGEHDMRMGLRLTIYSDVPMHIEIGDHAPIDELGFDKVPGKFDRLLLCHLPWQRKLDLAYELSILAYLGCLNVVPELFPVGPCLIGPFGQHHLAVDHTRLVGEVMRAPEPVIVQPLGSAIGCSGERRRSGCAGDGLGREVVHRHGDVPFTAFCARRHDV